jgi:hypothetical protein
VEVRTGGGLVVAPAGLPQLSVDELVHAAAA